MVILRRFFFPGGLTSLFLFGTISSAAAQPESETEIEQGIGTQLKGREIPLTWKQDNNKIEGMEAREELGFSGPLPASGLPFIL